MSTYMEIVEADDANPNTIKKSPKHWRNWWRITVPCVDQYGITHDPGDVISSLEIYPSRDIAETKASENMAWEMQENGSHSAEYLGAFPEGERP